MTYTELKKKQQEEVSAFPLMFAFGEKQFNEMLEQNNVTIKDIYSIGAGSYVRKTDAKAMAEMFGRHKRELAEARKQNKFLVQQFEYEMANHEYSYTRCMDDVLDACGITEDEYAQNEDIQKAWKKAKANYLRKVAEHND